MKRLHFMLPAVLVALATLTFAQSDAPKSDAQKPDVQKPDVQKEVQKTDAQKSFEKMKTLAGSWEGHITTAPPTPEIDGKLMQVSLRVTSMGNVLMHEMTGSGRPDDPITMMYLDGDRLMLTHYCDAGNRPRMTGKATSDGKAVDFEFLDVAGSTKYGHMHRAVFSPVDANHHTEDWTFMVGDKAVNAHVELQRTMASASK